MTGINNVMKEILHHVLNNLIYSSEIFICNILFRKINRVLVAYYTNYVISNRIYSTTLRLQLDISDHLPH